MNPQASPLPSIRDIAPPIDVFPYPMWMVVVAGGLALLLVLLAIWLIVRFLRTRPAPPPPTPQQIALARLNEVRSRINEVAPYEFSILVSDILRSYVSARYGLHATQQTSPEFLASLAHTPHFTLGEKTLLGAFLEKCDLIKFARVEATTEESSALLDQAIQFVKGGSENVTALAAAEMSA
ncbi:MAG: hypothetical protein QOD99_3038 [Chthoniobacter sp.]|jgi:hypothetical protein|nr:hypothetical protein [Chthoniobacter sp.]